MSSRAIKIAIDPSNLKISDIQILHQRTVAVIQSRHRTSLKIILPRRFSPKLLKNHLLLRVKPRCNDSIYVNTEIRIFGDIAAVKVPAIKSVVY